MLVVFRYAGVVMPAVCMPMYQLCRFDGFMVAYVDDQG